MIPVGQDAQLAPPSMKIILGCTDDSGTRRSWPVIWRPWLQCQRETDCQQKNSQQVTSREKNMSKEAHGFRHPVRICMPRSKTQEYLSYVGQKVLDSFPVQATLHFYNDDSSTEDDDDDDEDEEEVMRPYSTDMQCNHERYLPKSER